MIRVLFAVARLWHVSSSCCVLVMSRLPNERGMEGCRDCVSPSMAELQSAFAGASDELTQLG
jgi:hypothetical protein